MIVRNENFQQEDLNIILGEILNEFNANPNIEISEQEAKEALGQMVYEASLAGNQAILKNKEYAMPIAKKEYNETPVLSRIWEQLQTTVCPKFDEKTEREKIAQTVAEAISNLVPYRILVKPLLGIVLFFILKNGHTIICKNVQIPLENN